MADAIMTHPALQLLAVVLLSITVGLVHAGAKLIVAEGLGIIVLIILCVSLPFLRRYLD